MATCPSILVSVVNGVYVYQCIDCDNPATTNSVSSDHPLSCGCPPPDNIDCLEAGGFGSPGGGGLALAPAPARAKPPLGPVALAARFGDDNHVVLPALAETGLAAPLPAGFAWPLPGAEIDPGYVRHDAYHVVRVGGIDRYVHVVKARIRSPKNLLHVRYVGKKRVVHSIPDLEIRLGHETELPEGVSPRKMSLVGKPRPGAFYLQARRSGPKADPTIFHILLARR